MSLVDDLRATEPATKRRLDLLDRVVDDRNALGHGDEARIIVLESSREIRATKQSYVKHRRALDGLAGTLDVVVAAELARSLGIPRPW